MVDGFKAIIEFFQSFWDFFSGFVSDSFRLLSHLPEAFNSADSFLDFLPTFLVAPALFCLTVRILYLIIHTHVGGD